MIFAGVAPRSLRIVWGTGFAIVWLLRAWLAVRFAQREPRSTAGLERRLRAWQAGVLASGALWGIAAWFFSRVRQRPAPGRARPRRLHVLRRLGADPRRRSTACSSLFVLMIFAPAIARVALAGSAARLAAGGAS